MTTKTITEHIEQHKDKELIFWKKSKHRKDEKCFILIRPLGNAVEFWMETETGEGTGIASGLIYDVLYKLFKEVM